MTGAFQFDCRPGGETVIDVEAHLFPRKSVEEFCVAPITSEFFYGDGQPSDLQINRRPEIHDSDGLLIESGTGEWIWRPLRNPSANRLEVYAVDALRGFGLMQRDREPDHYADLNAPELRPSVWVEPLEGFGAGAVRLLELSAHDEYLDNVTAFWVPEQPPGVGEDRTVRYRLHFSLTDPAGHGGATVTRTVRQECGPDCARYSVDFTRGDASVPPPQSVVEAVVTATGGAARNVAVETLDKGGTFRAEFEVARSAGSNVTLRCFLRAGPDTLSETWSDTWESQ
jgi:glucans biosynthesis protein